jgi:hypothetical protein
MFKDITNCIDFEHRNPFLTLITSSCQSDSSFLIHHFLSFGIRSKKQVYFVNLSQTWSHYKSVQSKLGNSVQLNEQTEAGKFVNFDILKPKNTDSLIQMESQVDFWQQTFTNLITCLEEKNKNESDFECMVIIDDMSILNLIGCDENLIFELIVKLKAFTNLKLNLVMQLQSFWLNRHMINDLVYLADVYIKIEDLVTGYSKDIQGQVGF